MRSESVLCWNFGDRGKRWMLLPLLAAIALLGPGTAQGQRAESQSQIAEGTDPMPDLVYYRELYGDEPLFVAAEKVLLPTGQVNKQFYQETFADAIRAMLSRQVTGDCIDLNILGDPKDSTPFGRTDLASAVVASDNVVVARITGLRFGMIRDRPGTLLRISPEEVTKGSAPWSERFVFFPVGNFQVGNARLCVRNPHWGKLPEIGTRILVLFKEYWYNQKSPILDSGATSIIGLDIDGRVDLPAFYRETDPGLKGKPTESFLESVRQKARRAEPR